MMSGVPHIIERAFQLALGCANIEQIRSQLRKEGYSSVDAHLMGRKIRADLVRVMRKEFQAQAASPDVPGYAAVALKAAS